VRKLPLFDLSVSLFESILEEDAAEAGRLSNRNSSFDFVPFCDEEPSRSDDKGATSGNAREK